MKNTKPNQFDYRNFMLNDDKHTWSSNCIPPQDRPVLKWKKKISLHGYEGKSLDNRPSFGPGGNIYVTTNSPIFLLNLDFDGKIKKKGQANKNPLLRISENFEIKKAIKKWLKSVHAKSLRHF